MTQLPTRRVLAVALLAALLHTGCMTTPSEAAVDGAATSPAMSESSDGRINAADFASSVQTLSSDAFGGRAPGSAGEQMTVDFLEAEFRRLGLQPGNNGSFVQNVPMVETTAAADTVLNIAGPRAHALKFGTDMVLGTRTGRADITVKNSDLVFVGYGVNAPEQGWNDSAGVDVKGKTVVILVNDPGFHQQDAQLFDGKRMTYYGRWTYKYEEAARQGAAGALIIHDTAGASYGWDVVRNSWSGAQFDLQAADDPEPRLPVQGWITGEVARELMRDSGLDLDAMYKRAGTRGFKAVPLKSKASTNLRSTTRTATSRNVIATLPGATRPAETVVYMAHWDHLGDKGHAGEAAAGPDAIYNGAVDNATGVAGILEIAEAFARGPRPQRSVTFLAVTLEESGLLGSKYYVAKPVIALRDTVGVINLDAMSVLGRARDMIVVGDGSSELEDILKPILATQGRVMVAEPTPEAGYYFRSDHFNFAKAGVPALYAKGGDDLIDGGAAAGAAKQLDYRANRYHKPSDQFDPAWPLDGVVQDLEVLYGVGASLANSDARPRWYPTNAFRAAQDKLLGTGGTP